jgi:ABC-type Fe3+-hydroxamate transport system substrate-binding protein
MGNRIFFDQLGRSCAIPERPKRIISLVPSQTELLAYFGLEDEVIGITKFCIYPEDWFKNKTRIGGTKNLTIQKIIELKPDLIIGNKEENTIEDIEVLEKHFPVWLSDVNSFDDALEMINSLGEIVQKQQIAQELISQIQANFNQIQTPTKKQKVLYLIWDDPLIAVGRNTYIHSILEKIGFENFITEDRYPMIENNLVSQPDIIFLSTEPYPFKAVHLGDFQKKYPHSKIILVDGEMFSWYGSRMSEAPAYLLSLATKLSSKHID